MYYKYPAIESKQIASISIEHIRCGIVAPSIVRLVSIHLHIFQQKKKQQKKQLCLRFHFLFQSWYSVHVRNGLMVFYALRKCTKHIYGYDVVLSEPPSEIDRNLSNETRK